MVIGNWHQIMAYWLDVVVHEPQLDEQVDTRREHLTALYQNHAALQHNQYAIQRTCGNC